MSGKRSVVETKDFVKSVFDTTAQIPHGRVSTYGEIATALGDVGASRAVGMILASNPRPIIVPCHRVVYSNGEIGWYGGKGKGTERKKELLSKEGVRIEGGKVADFENLRFANFDIEPILKNLRRIQDALSKKVVEEDDFGKLTYVAGLDVSYAGDDAFASMVLYDWSENRIVDRRTIRSRAIFPYIPSYLAFREIPVLADLIDSRKDTVYLVDGQGVLHPRAFGIASHIGVAFDIPTIGVAKSLLCGVVENGKATKSRINLDGRSRGYFIGRSGKHSVYVSVGHRISLKSAVKIVSRSLEIGKVDPMREAHRLANSARRSASEAEEAKE
ncbi:MAG: endonuclease V [Methanomassiliicoccales archaeon]